MKCLFNLIIPDPIWNNLSRASELTGLSRKQLIVCILESVVWESIH